MKNTVKKCILFLAIFLATLFVFETGSHAIEVIAGAKIWYASWIPWVRDAGQTAEDRYFGFQNVEKGGGFMYGVSSAVRFTDNISLSLSYLYGVLDSEFEHEDRAQLSGGDTEFQQFGTAEIKRHDLDTALSYSVNSWFKVFAGYKFQPLKIEMDQRGAEKNSTSQAYVKMFQKSELASHCPALGAGVAFPFYDVFIFNANLSALYLKGHLDYTLEMTKYPDADLDNPQSDGLIKAEMDLTGWGTSVETSVVTIIKEDILLVLGFRYQMMVVRGVYKPESGSDDITYDDMKDHVYGAYMNVMYRFR